MSLSDYQSDIAEDMLDDAIRQALWERAGVSGPPDEVWHRISRQVSAGPSPHRRPPVHSLRQLFAPLMQGLAVAAMLVLIGVSLGPNLWVESYRLSTDEGFSPRKAELGVERSARFEPSVLSIPQGTGVVLDPPVNDMLSEGSLRRLQRQAAARELPKLDSAPPLGGQAVDPSRDPLLINRHFPLRGS